MNNKLYLLSLCTVLLLNPVLISKCYAKNADESTDKLSIEVKRAIDENFFISHTTPWEEFSGLGTDTNMGIKYLYEFPTKTFGKLEATTDKGVKIGKDVTEVGKNHLLYGEALLHNATGEIMEIARTIALQHHERLDGNGYLAYWKEWK